MPIVSDDADVGKTSDRIVAISQGMSVIGARLFLEISKLRERIEKEKDRVAKVSPSIVTAARDGGETYRCKSSQDTGCTTLALEVPRAIDIVILNADAPLHIHDLSTDKDTVYVRDVDQSRLDHAKVQQIHQIRPSLCLDVPY